MRLLLTGATGFVAPHVARKARELLGSACVIGGAAPDGPVSSDFDEAFPIDLTDTTSVDAAFSDFRPTHVVHLGGVSDYQTAEADYETAWNTNTLGTLRCARALHSLANDGVFIFVSSAQVYGEPGADRAAFSETAPLAPKSEYARTKIAAEQGIAGMSQKGLSVVCFRPFNHTGPGQGEIFVVPRFAYQIARIERGLQEPVLKVGNLEARRDFLDVRDVAEAYVAALIDTDAVRGETLNLASGRAETIRWILDYLVGLSEVPVEIVTDTSLWRPGEQSVLVGDAAKARAILRWRPRFTLEDTLRDVLMYCRQEVASTSG